MLVGGYGLLLRVLDVDQVSGRGSRLAAVGQNPGAERRFFADDAMNAIAAIESDGDFLPGVVVSFEVVEDQVDQVIQSGDGLKLDFPEDGALQGFGKCRFNLFASGLL